MYKHFKPIIKLKHSYTLNENHGLYLSFKEAQLSEVQDLLTFAYETSEGQSHTDFIKSYALNMQEHIESLKRYKLLLESASEELLQLLNSFGELGQALVSEGFEYSLNIDIDTLYFFKSIGYDSYLRSEGYMIFEFMKGKKGYSVNQLSIGFTNEKPDVLRNEPSFIHRQISKFQELTTLEEINRHSDYCEELLINYFGVEEIYEIFHLEDSLAKQLIGEPLELYREIYRTAMYYGIKISLPVELKMLFNEEIFELIEAELRLYKKEAHKDILKEKYEMYCASLEEDKKMLMESLFIEQNLLDEYMSYVPKEMKE